MNSNNRKPKKIVGLAISGGWIRAAAAIGVIEILEENGISIDMVSGTSAGAVVASVYAAGHLPELKKRLILGKPRDYLQIMVEPANPVKGFFKGKRTTEFWNQYLDDKKFEDVEMKLFLATTDLNTFSPHILDKGKIAPAVQACVNIPGMFVPFEHEGMILADGGYFNLIPSKVLYDHGADYVISVDVSKKAGLMMKIMAAKNKLLGQSKCLPGQGKTCKNPNIFSIIYRAIKLAAIQLHALMPGAYHSDVLIRPDIDSVRRWHVRKVDYLIKRGREAALKSLLQIKHDLEL